MISEREFLRERSIDGVCLESDPEGSDVAEELAACLRGGGIAAAAYLRSLSGASSFCSSTDAGSIEEGIRRLAGRFDEILIAALPALDCDCPECRKRKGRRSWRDFRQSAMLELVRQRVLAPARETNPSVTLGLVVPASAPAPGPSGYHPASLAQQFDRAIVGTDAVSDTDEGGSRSDSYVAFRWLAEVVGRKAAGVMLPADRTCEDAAEAMLAGAVEVVAPIDPRDPASIDRFDELLSRRSILGQLAGVARKTPMRGVAAYRPMLATEGARDAGIASWRLRGLPLRPTPRFPASSKASLFTAAALDDPRLVPELAALLESGGIAAATAGLIEGLASRDGGPEIIPRLLVLPELHAPSGPTLEAARRSPETPEFDGVRDLLLAPLGVRFSAPRGVTLSLFGFADVVVQNRSADPARFRLELEGKRFRAALSSDESISPGEEIERIVLAPGEWVHLRG